MKYSFTYKPPQNTSTLSAELLLKGCELRDVIDKDAGKSVTINGNKFLVYDMTKDLIDGGITVVLDIANPKKYEIEMNAVASGPDAIPIPTRGYYEKVWVYRGVLKTLLEEDDR